MREWRFFPVLLAVPGLGLAAAGLLHPTGLSYDTAPTWFGLHLPGIVFFPLVGWALAALFQGRVDLVSWLVRALAYTYAVFYTSLDVISGVAAGFVTRQLGPDVPRPEAVSLLFRIGGPLGEIGSWALLACVVVVLADHVRRLGAPALVGLLLLPGAWLGPHQPHLLPARGSRDGAPGRRPPPVSRWWLVAARTRERFPRPNRQPPRPERRLCLRGAGRPAPGRRR